MTSFFARPWAWLLALLLSLPLTAPAQVTVFTETFETPVGNPFTIVNEFYLNYWTLNTGAGNGPTLPGQNAAYITYSNTGRYTGQHLYNTASTSVVHLYRTVTFPTGVNLFELSFDWKNMGELAELDYLKLYLVPTTYTPVAGTPPPSSMAIMPTGLRQQGSYVRASYEIPNSAAVAGTTQRLVITWANNASGGSQPPGAIDNIVLTGRTVAPLNGTYTIDTSRPASSTNFTSLSAAFQRLNQGPTGGPVTFEVAPNQVHGLPPALTRGGTRANPVVFRKTGAGTNPVVETTHGAAVIDLVGVDYVTFDGIDVRAIGTGSGPNTGYRIRNATPTDGCRNITVQNATIALFRTNTSSTGVLQGSTSNASPDDTTGCNARTRYRNLLLTNCATGIRVTGYTNALPEYDVELDHLRVGDGTPGDIAGAFAVELGSTRAARMHDCVVSGIGNSEKTLYGLYLVGPAGSGPDATRIYNNRFHDISQGSGSLTGLNVTYGMYVSVGDARGAEVQIYNNELRDLHRPAGTASATSSSRMVQGIYLVQLSLPSSLLLAHNTVVIDNRGGPGYSSAALELGSPVSVRGRLTLRNNLWANRTGAAPSSITHMAVFASGAQLGTNNPSDYNNYFVPEPTNLVVRTTLTPYATLAAWQTATGYDANSVSVDPVFGAGPELRPTNPQLDNRGAPVPGISTDLTGAPRSATTPDVGAYEFAGVLSARPRRDAALGLQAWPNPFRQELEVRVAAHRGGELQLLDNLGRVVARQTVAAGARPRLATAALPAGIYLLRFVQPDGQQQTIRVVRE